MCYYYFSQNGEIEGDTKLGAALFDAVQSIPPIEPVAFERFAKSVVVFLLLLVSLIFFIFFFLKKNC